MTQVSSPPFGGALEIPRQSEEQKQGAGLTTSFAHGRALGGVSLSQRVSPKQSNLSASSLGPRGKLWWWGPSIGTWRADIRRMIDIVPRLHPRSSLMFSSG